MAELTTRAVAEAMSRLDNENGSIWPICMMGRRKWGAHLGHIQAVLCLPRKQLQSGSLTTELILFCVNPAPISIGTTDATSSHKRG